MAPSLDMRLATGCSAEGPSSVHYSIGNHRLWYVRWLGKVPLDFISDSPPSLPLFLIPSVSAVCTTAGQANTLSYYDRRKWFGDAEDAGESGANQLLPVTNFGHKHNITPPHIAPSRPLPPLLQTLPPFPMRFSPSSLLRLAVGSQSCSPTPSPTTVPSRNHPPSPGFRTLPLLFPFSCPSC